jgi:type IV pilus assembly protein PilB
MSPSAESIEVLKVSYLFRDLPDAILAKVAERLVFENYNPRETIFREGQEGDALFLIASGSVEIRKKDRESGIEFHLNRLEAPASFGEIALLKAGPRSATVVSVQDTRTAVLRGPDFYNLVKKLPEFAMAVAKGLAERVDELSRERKITYSQLSQLDYDAQVMSMLPKKSLLDHKMVPLGYNGSSLSVAMVDPQNQAAMDELRRQIRGVMIEPIVVSEMDFKRFMDTIYDRVTRPQQKEDPANAVSPGGKIDINDLMHELDEDLRKLKGHGEDSIVTLTRNLLLEAVRNSASELHIEPQAERILIRYRVNGQLQNGQELQRGLQADLLRRYKLMAGLDIENNSTHPQHGSIDITENDLNVSFQVDTVPTRYGEKMVISMPETGSIPALANLVGTANELQNISRLLNIPYGLLLVSGPPGAGKTTTLYSILRQLSERPINAYAIGQRMAFDLPNVNRVDIDEAGISMIEAMQATLAQRPDVILLESLPDFETFQLALDAAMTGHLVISSFAATDLDAALRRYEMMGGQRADLLEALSGVITQRLLRRLCPACREAYQPDSVVLQRLGLNEADTLYRPKGCSVCDSTGYRGQSGLHEVIVLDSHQRQLLRSGQPLHSLYDYGLRSLRQVGMELLRNGETTPQELIRELRL